MESRNDRTRNNIKNKNDMKYETSRNREGQNAEFRKDGDREADEKVVFEGNAFYEIDLKCVRERQKKN